MRQFPLLFIGLFLTLTITLELYHRSLAKPNPAMPPPQQIASGYNLAPLASPSPTPQPTLSPEQLEAQYGPCVRLPVLMYHHIDKQENALAGGYTNLNVTPEVFRTQLQYLKDKNYQVIPITALNDFFDSQIKPPSNGIILTFDDGYADFTDNAAPILVEFNYPATLFVTTGLIENPGYSTWKALASLSPTLFYLGNHTWSHHNLQTTAKIIDFELQTATSQLAEHGFNSHQIFAYPYGLVGDLSQAWLKNNSYTLAFTTAHKLYHCQALRLTLGRIRVGNAALSTYGL